MKSHALLFTLLLTCPDALADDYLYVSVAGERRIAVYTIDAQGGLVRRADMATGGEPGALAVEPTRYFLFASIRSTGYLASYRIDGLTGKLSFVSTVTAGDDPAYLSTDRKGQFLLTAYYKAAKVTTHSIAVDGVLSPNALQTIETAEKAHAIVADPSNRFVFVPHTGANAIFQFTFDADAGRLTANAVPKLATPGGTGPRHLAFHPTKAIAYVVNEQGGSVTGFTLDEKTGTLKPIQTVSTLPEGFTGANATAEIKIHPSGKFLYASNRGRDSIACFALDDDGKLTAAGQVHTERTPRSFDLTRDGGFLFAAGEASGKVAAYRIDQDEGRPVLLKTYDVGRQPWWVMAVDFPGAAP
ncbi:MAG TPA: lactonase family protein [Pirellulales bacterium]|jgi:6-phosphogluconolactonase|nr:lactonase family protein [Pirellulales bacterium]